MGKKQKSKSHRQPKREKSQQQVKQLTGDLVYKSEGLPADVVYEIMVRLPAESLVKFRCVCKQWCSLISHPSFQQDHYRIQSLEDPLFLVIRKEFGRTNVHHFSTYDINEETVVSNFSKILPLLPLDTDISLIQSCQGLMCLVDDYICKRHIFLCNPSTRELIALPPTNEANYCVAFGITDSGKNVKVVRFFVRKELGETNNLCEVFTPDTSEWREARCPPPQDQQFWLPAHFLHGAIHLKPRGNGAIHAFDIESEEYRVIPQPEIYDYPEMMNEPQFNVLSGFLCLTRYLDKRYELWLLKDYNNRKWVKEYTIAPFCMGTPSAILGDGSLLLEIYGLKEYTIDHFYIGTPSAILGDGSILLDINVETYLRKYGNGALYCYNLRDKTYTQKLEYHPQAITTSYVGSLFALGR